MAAEPETEVETPDTSSFTESVLGSDFFTANFLTKLRAYPLALRAAVASAAFAALLLLPYLGAVGLWDPWETHYGEVAREMIQRNDYVYPYWENAWFFSKPAFTMWMQALGMQILGSDIASGPGALGRYTEWGMRLPFAMFSILAVGLLSYAISRVTKARIGLATAFVLSTMPMYFLISRQAVTDTPVVSAMVCAMACFLVGQLDQETKHRSAWWYGFYAFCAIGTLAKGLLGLAIPFAVVGLYALICVVPWDKWQEHLKFAARVWLQPAAYTLGGAIIIGSLGSIIGQALGTGFFDSAAFPGAGIPKFPAHVWLGVAWFVMGGWAVGTFVFWHFTRKEREVPELWAQLFRMRLGSGVLLFMAIAVPWYYVLFTFKSVDDESKTFWIRFIHDHFGRMFAGVHTTTPESQFIYFIQQGGYAIFPWVAAVPGAFAVLAGLKARSKDTLHHVGFIAVIWLALTFGLIGGAATKFHHYVFPMLPPLAILIGIFLHRLWEEGLNKHAAALLVGIPLALLVGRDLFAKDDPGRRDISLKNFTDLFVYNYDRPYPREEVAEEVMFGADTCKTQPNATCVTTREMLGSAFTFALVLLIGMAVFRSKVGLFATGWAAAAMFAMWFNWVHWVKLSHHWTQRDQFWHYFDNRKPDEPITSFFMNWRGETFYSRNQVKQIKDNNLMAQYAAQPGRKWALVEHNRFGILQSAVGPDKKITKIKPGLNNKFLLVTIE